MTAILELSANCIRFESVTKNVNVFYDESNRQLFIVRNRCAEGVIVKGPEGATTHFKLDDKGDVLSIKFSPTCDVLAVQRNAFAVEFINFSNGEPISQYSHTAKSKNSRVLGFIWTNAHEIVFITDTGIELYAVYAERNAIKCLKSFNITVEWFVYQPKTCVLLLANGTFGNVIQVFQFRPNTAYKLSKFEIDWPNKSKTTKLSLFERDVAFAYLYGNTCLLVLRHQPVFNDNIGAHILIYTFLKDSVPSKTDILLLHLTGRFAINIVDNLIVVHHQTSQTSLIFDINLQSNQVMGTVKVHEPIFKSATIKPVISDENTECELYSTNWVIFQPNIIIDAKLGCLWLLNINLNLTIDLIPSIPLLIDFLLFRRNSKSVILKVCKNSIIHKGKCSNNLLGNLSLIFNKLNNCYKETLNSTDQLVANNDLNKHHLRTIIDQTDIFSNVFSVFEENKLLLDNSLIVSILFEYILSLSQHQIAIQYFVYEILITHLVGAKLFYQLHQFFQYHVFTDSKPLACLLLSLEPHYPHAVQLALDMLKRLSIANDEIVEVLLSQYQLAKALRFIQTHCNVDSISARKFLEVALTSQDDTLFYSIFKFFELRNLRLRGSANFAKGEHCELYIEHFKKLFGTTTSLNDNIINSLN